MYRNASLPVCPAQGHQAPAPIPTLQGTLAVMQVVLGHMHQRNDDVRLWPRTDKNWLSDEQVAARIRKLQAAPPPPPALATRTPAGSRPESSQGMKKPVEKPEPTAESKPKNEAPHEAQYPLLKDWQGRTLEKFCVEAHGTGLEGLRLGDVPVVTQGRIELLRGRTPALAWRNFEVFTSPAADLAQPSMKGCGQQLKVGSEGLVAALENAMLNRPAHKQAPIFVLTDAELDQWRSASLASGCKTPWVEMLALPKPRFVPQHERRRQQEQDRKLEADMKLVTASRNPLAKQCNLRTLGMTAHHAAGLQIKVELLGGGDPLLTCLTDIPVLADVHPNRLARYLYGLLQDRPVLVALDPKQWGFKPSALGHATQLTIRTGGELMKEVDRMLADHCNAVIVLRPEDMKRWMKGRIGRGKYTGQAARISYAGPELLVMSQEAPPPKPDPGWLGRLQAAYLTYIGNAENVLDLALVQWLLGRRNRRN